MTIAEIMVVLGIISIALFAINYLVTLSLQANGLGLLYTKGIFFAQEGLEVMRILKNQDWQSNITPLGEGTLYYPVLTGGTWSLETVSPGSLDSIFTRFITIEDVFRDADQNIAPSGTLDPDAKKITVTVRWQHSTGQKEINIPAYMTNIALP